jgi:hypothetical protein
VVYADRQLDVDASQQTSLAKTLVKSALGFGLKVGMDMLTQRMAGQDQTLTRVADTRE